MQVWFIHTSAYLTQELSPKKFTNIPIVTVIHIALLLKVLMKFSCIDKLQRETQQIKDRQSLFLYFFFLPLLLPLLGGLGHFASSRSL